uniref:Protein-export membrane protein SecG n=2 Tax=Gracilariopsis TaxID=2781 RepID=A0A1C9CEV3_9FLOR|nr:hypothetical protein [Gracilariopsis lemaneiformis]YP_009294614.1 hypothetical protein Gch_015 [Gracilariopsis chorda]AJO68455.1 hypothetical protein [Gracilariopsis lemaneiformis]AML79957.1 hypothetical protein [Gracilariopsis lemaneiformis]AOM66874.1 hypothetical protein Gch_015 [Gracilariopsis chorda]UAD88865.1 Preprotein translocase SecG subunit [Gracilariopsis chorda]
MKVLWYIVGNFTILLILINNPKLTNLSGFRIQATGLNFTRSTQKNLQIITIISIFLFLLLTVINILYSDI